MKTPPPHVSAAVVLWLIGWRQCYGRAESCNNNQCKNVYSTNEPSKCFAIPEALEVIKESFKPRD